MNTYVSKLGLQNTHFQTVHGLDAQGQYSSARDMALIGQALIRDVPDEYAIYKEKEFTFNNIRQMNRNGLLWDTSLNVDGIKTGHTDAAGYNLVASATEGQMRLISAVLGGTYLQGPRKREQETADLGLPLLRNRCATESR
jgi:serine-type D-Ala-D-Ala carboxypeptidase (penicillin-binding protein 5/6)